MHILGTSAGVCESRSVRRLPESEQWDAEMVLGMRGLPWSDSEPLPHALRKMVRQLVRPLNPLVELV